MNTFSYDSGISDQPLLGETIGENLKKIVELYPERDALVVRHQNYRATYSEFWKEVALAAKAMLVMGIQKGDRVGIWAPNRYEWVIIQYATARIGAIMVNINPAYKALELKFVLNQSGVAYLFLSKGFRNTDYLEILEEVTATYSDFKKTIILDRDWQHFLSLANRCPAEELLQREVNLEFDDPINIQYTSGTTGFPKGATLTHHNILNNGYFIGERLNYSSLDRVCIPVPFYHCFGMVLGNLACTTHGSCMVIPDESFDPITVLQTVQEERCTSLYGVPLMFIKELEHPDFDKYDYSSLRTGIMAGSSCPEKTMRDVQSRMHMTEVAICYGMTETSPVSTQTFIDDPLDKRVSTVGKVHPHLEIKIIDPKTRKIVPRGQFGELCTRGYSVMLKYWNDEHSTAKVLDQAHWMHTGDLASMDEEGYVKITGRIKDMILRGGENIAPLEIEEYLRTHPAISQTYVIGIPDYKYGEVVMAWIQLKDGVSIAEEELVRFCKGKIATYKIPKYWKFTDYFPTTVTGKIRKVEMREISIRELGIHGRESEDIRLETENGIN